MNAGFLMTSATIAFKHRIEFRVYGTPAPAGSKRALPIGGRRGRRMIVVDASKRARPWKQQVAQEAGRAMNGMRLFRCPLALELIFYVARPKSHFGKRGLKPSAPEWPAKRPDLLKLARAVEDALTGIVYADDALIVMEALAKRYTEGAECVEVVVRPLLPELKEV